MQQQDQTAKKPHHRAGLRPPNAPAGRKDGAKNKVPYLLKECILMAAEEVGNTGAVLLGEGDKARYVKHGGKEHKRGLTEFLMVQAMKKDNAPFMGLLGKVLPLIVQGDPNAPVEHKVTIELVRPPERPTDPAIAPPRRMVDVTPRTMQSGTQPK